MRIVDIAIIILFFTAIVTSSIALYNFSKYTEVANGIYFTSNRTAIINMDRTWEEVMETCNHEYAHATHYQHFTEDPQ